jgi:tight adherence protein C
VTRALLLAVLAAVLAANGLVELAATMALRERGRRAERSAARRRVAWALARLGRRLGVAPPPVGLAARLAAAGGPLGLGVGELMAIKSGAALVALLAAVPVVAGLPGRLGAIVLGAAPAAGFLVPDAWLAARVRARADAMSAELPDLLELLRVGLEAGLPLERALAEVARRHRGVLAAEWGRAASELALGLARAAVLDRLAQRCPADGMPAFVAALERAGRHGSPLARTLAAQAADARAARSRRMRERAARAAPKIQLVVALALVPAVMLIVAAALVRALLGAR